LGQYRSADKKNGKILKSIRKISKEVYRISAKGAFIDKQLAADFILFYYGGV